MRAMVWPSSLGDRPAVRRDGKAAAVQVGTGHARDDLPFRALEVVAHFAVSQVQGHGQAVGAVGGVVHELLVRERYDLRAGSVEPGVLTAEADELLVELVSGSDPEGSKSTWAAGTGGGRRRHRRPGFLLHTEEALFVAVIDRSGCHLW